MRVSHCLIELSLLAFVPAECHRVGSEFVVEPYNPYRFSQQFGYTPTIRGLSSSTREMVDLTTSLRFWHACILSRARKTVTFPGNTSPHSPPISYKNWLNKLFPSEAPRSVSMKHGKWKGLPAASFRLGLPVVVEVSSSVSDQVRTELFDTGESSECLAVEVAESCPPVLPTLTISQGAAAILRIGVSSLWSCIWTGLEKKSPEMVLKEEESAMKTFEVLTQMGLGNFPDLRDKLQGFFQKARKMDVASSVTQPDSTSEDLQKLSLLRVSFEDQPEDREDGVGGGWVGGKC
ncbi:hypothetical protein LIER_05184 [Lithospermum erythrorhizon]|uniref:Uncharacterized protein n=1 Tax=Lithospermum erythrorhizon TaxID=34254 RepID=A0AAV3P0T7_LITER